MFGYVKALTGELRVKEYELYKSVYCGLCHHIKKRGRFMTFSLSYDFVLPSLFALAFTDRENISFKKKRCLAHPFKARKVLDGGDAMQSVADAAVLLVYYKLLDDKNDRDKGFFRRISSSFALLFARSARKSVLKAGLTHTDEIIRRSLDAIALCEKEKCESVYEGATIFGNLLAEVFSSLLQKESDRRCMHEIGYHVGRWIYIADALDDIGSDRRSGSYNPLVLSLDDTNSESFKQNIEISLRIELEECEKAMNLLEINDKGLLAIIENTLYLGMPDVISRILVKNFEKTKK